jgi:hypothetical protein
VTQLVFDGIIISLIVGFFRKGNLKSLPYLKFKHGWIFPLLLAIEITVFILQNKIKILGEASGYIYIAVYVLGLLFLFLNRKNPGFLFILLGVLLNFLPIVLNGGRMPVSLKAASVLDPGYLDALKSGLYAKHAVLTHSTKLGFLGDIIPLTKPYPKTQIISIGDIIMNIGAFIYIQYIMLRHPMAGKSIDSSLSIEGGEKNEEIKRC